MTRIPYTVLVFALSFAFIGTSQAADLARGKQLLDQSCIKCHASIVGGDGSKIFTRPQHKIHSLDALAQQVQRCHSHVHVSWSKAKIADVVAYLNKTYYKFKK